jgi:GTP 3',8-cyclase
MATVLESIPGSAPGEAERLTDKHGRAITDLRISVTDRCNYKCVYCRTGNEWRGSSLRWGSRRSG